MPQFQITAVEVDTTQPIPVYSAPRTEVIDTSSNAVFAECVSMRDVEFAYESFWNYPSGGETVQKPAQRIKVLKVVRLF